MSTETTDRPNIAKPETSNKWARWEPLTGIAFAVFFLGSIVASNPPKGSASDSRWVANYATRGKQLHHLATGLLLVLAGLCLMAFLVTLWTRVAAARSSRRTSPLPLVAAGTSAASIAVGGVIMASVSGNALFGSAPVPGADLLRFANGLGFALVGVAGMLSAALSLTCLSVQARSRGIFTNRLFGFSLLVAVLLLAGVAFVPIFGLLLWSIIVAIALIRNEPTQRS
jgi:hypothetical protein